MLRGELWVANLGDDVGHKTVLVVSEDGINIGMREPIVVRVTARDRERTIATAIPIDPHPLNNLREDSTVLCHDVTTLRERDFVARVGELLPNEMELVDNGLRLALRLE